MCTSSGPAREGHRRNFGGSLHGPLNLGVRGLHRRVIFRTHSNRKRTRSCRDGCGQNFKDEAVRSVGESSRPITQDRRTNDGTLRNRATLAGQQASRRRRGGDPTVPRRVGRWVRLRRGHCDLVAAGGPASETLVPRRMRDHDLDGVATYWASYGYIIASSRLEPSPEAWPRSTFDARGIVGREPHLLDSLCATRGRAAQPVPTSSTGWAPGVAEVRGCVRWEIRRSIVAALHQRGRVDRGASAEVPTAQPAS